MIQGVSNEEDRVQGLDRGLNLAGEELEGGCKAGGAGGGAEKAKLDRGQLTQQAGKLSAKQLAAEGLYKAKDGAILDKKTGNIVKDER